MSKGINPLVLEAAEALTAGATIDSATGSITYTPEAQENASKIVGLAEFVEGYQKGLPLLIAAGRLSTAQVSKEPMANTAELGMTRSDIKVGKDVVTSKFHRQRDTRHPTTGVMGVSRWGSSTTISSTVTKTTGQNRLVSEHIQTEMYASMALDA